MSLRELKLFDDVHPTDHIQGADNYINYDSDLDSEYQRLNAARLTVPLGTIMNVFVIPYWVEDKLFSLTNDYNSLATVYHIRIDQYTSCYKYLTEEEKLSILVLNNLPLVVNSKLNVNSGNNSTFDLFPDNSNIGLMAQWYATKGDLPFPYFNSKYNIMKNDYKDIVIKRLTEKENFPVETTPYTFRNNGDNLTIVLNSNFYSYISSLDQMLIFFRDLLKEIHTKISLEKVVNSDYYQNVFRVYLELLKTLN